MFHVGVVRNQVVRHEVEQFSITNEEQATTAESALRTAAGGKLDVLKVEKKQRRRNPAPPFITSTLQQEASRKLGFSSDRTMKVAQRLFEGVNIDLVYGLPGQTADDLARDVLFMRDRDVDMVGMGPFIPHRDTPMAGSLGDTYDFVLGVTIPMTSLCPCSKEISAYGAHNQRSHVTVTVRVESFLWIEELIERGQSQRQLGEVRVAARRREAGYDYRVGLRRDTVLGRDHDLDG